MGGGDDEHVHGVRPCSTCPNDCPLDKCALPIGFSHGPYRGVGVVNRPKYFGAAGATTTVTEFDHAGETDTVTVRSTGIARVEMTEIVSQETTRADGSPATVMT